MKNCYICIHGHFYQPPRENPWLEAIELQDSAYPYRDWNERITTECYGPNTASRVLDANNDIIAIVNNYSKISFDFGPTLLSWLGKNHPAVYQAVLEADKVSQKTFSGHGSAMAQAYNHMIMPLASDRDKRTQVIWGIRDFDARFQRWPEGMWLPETAVDTGTLEILAEEGIRFTVLAPRQMKRFRKIGEKEWHAVSTEGAVNPQRPYLCRLPSGKSLALFFYDGPISRDVAFGGLLNSGELFAKRLMASFPTDINSPRLAHVATDGESYGHHHQFGNMALTYCLYFLETNKLARLTNYGEFLELSPPEYEAEISENSSWSCDHGVERWRANCGCNVGSHRGWHQRWREPLRSALDWLRDQVEPLYEKEMLNFFKAPWEVRDDLIFGILDRSPGNAVRFVKRRAFTDLTATEFVRILKLLELARHTMLMYTSCGWFFDDIAGIESVQILQYASRVIQLAGDLFGTDLEPEFLRRLEKAASNMADKKNGREIYLKQVKPNCIGLLDVAAHFAISSLFEHYPNPAEVYAYTLDCQPYFVYTAGKQSLAIGAAKIKSRITWEQKRVDFVVLHLGDYNLYAGVRPGRDEDDFARMHERLRATFSQNNIPSVVQLINEVFGPHNYSLWNLFKNEQGRVLNQVFNNTLSSIESHFREIYEHYYPLMQIKPEFRVPLPKALSMTVEFILNRDMVETLEARDLDLEKLEKVAKEIRRWGFMRDKESLGMVATNRIEALMESFSQKPHQLPPMTALCSLLEILQPLSLPLNLWKAQNILFAMARDTAPGMRRHSREGDTQAREWTALFERLGKFLKVKVLET